MEEQIKDYRLKLGNNIRTVREKSGYSQEQLAEKMDINRSTILKLKMGNMGLQLITWFDFRFFWILSLGNRKLIYINFNKNKIRK